MRLTGSAVLTAVFTLAAVVTSFYMLYRISKEKGGTHALLGFLFPPYLYVWGWIESRRLEIVDVMIFWTFVSAAAVVFPLLMGLSSAARITGYRDFSVAIAESSDVTRRGPIAPGSQVQGQIEDLFAMDEWTFSGAAGQEVTIWAAAAAGSETDPRVNILGPDGQVLASDDDGGEGKTALLSNLTLPSSGTYTIQVDVWTTGPYILSLE
ncbi:MAG: PPC domain-containing protein [Anaerolineales bacterium]|jgi:hypothetical protein